MSAVRSYEMFAVSVANLHGRAFNVGPVQTSRRAIAAMVVRRFFILSRGRLLTPRKRMGAAPAVDAPTSLLDFGRGRFAGCARLFART